MVTYEQLCRLRSHEDTTMLDQWEHDWLSYTLLSALETEPFERAYYKRLAVTTDALIVQLQAKMVRRYM